MSIIQIDPLVKISHVVQIVEQKMALTPKGERIAIHLAIANQPPLMVGDMKAILSKLEQDEEVLTLHTYPGGRAMGHDGKLTLGRSPVFLLTPNSKFPAYAQRLRIRLEESQKNNQLAENVSVDVDELPSNQVPLAACPSGTIFIRFDDMNRHILLNDCFLIAQPAYDSENYRFFEYVWKNPDRVITLDELNRTLDEPLKKPISKIVENLNFRGPLKDAFFKVSKTSVLFTPIQTMDTLTAAGLYPLRLYSTQKVD